MIHFCKTQKHLLKPKKKKKKCPPKTPSNNFGKVSNENENIIIGVVYHVRRGVFFSFFSPGVHVSSRDFGSYITGLSHIVISLFILVILPPSVVSHAEYVTTVVSISVYCISSVFPPNRWSVLLKVIRNEGTVVRDSLAHASIPVAWPAYSMILC